MIYLSNINYNKYNKIFIILMENQDKQKNIRLTPNQKKIIELINKSGLISSIELDSNNDDIDINILDQLNIKFLKQFNEVHNNINKILTENNIEPHEIFTLINNYEGNNEDFNKLKNFIISRNILIIKKIYGSEQWNKNINKITEIFKMYYSTENIKNIFDSIIMDFLLKDISMFDIAQCKISLDSKNNLKNINIISLNDQKYIINRLIEKGCKKR